MSELRFPWESDPFPTAAKLPLLPSLEPTPKKRGRRPIHHARPSADGPGWLYLHLTVSGPAAEVAGFATAARGSGVIPWQIDYAAIEEDIFNLAASQPPHRRTLTIEGCRILARQFRHRVEARQDRAAALIGTSRACPLDLHTLLPIPVPLLERGPKHSSALAWLMANWGTTDGLRQVAERTKPSAGRRLPGGHAVVGYGFFTAGDSPSAAVTQLERRWPGLRMALKPRPSS